MSDLPSRPGDAQASGPVPALPPVVTVEAPTPPAGELTRHEAIDYDLDPQRSHWVVQAFKAATPGLHFLTHQYRRSWWRTDVIAGLAVAAYLIPQVMAYTAIVNVPPEYGLYTALVALLVYAAMGSSRVLSVGPESTIALLTGMAISPMAKGDPSRVLALSAALAILVGVWCLIARALRLGVMADLLSQPLLIGYLAGAAVLMVVGQLGKITGTHVGGESIVAQVRGFLDVVDETKLMTLWVALGTLAFILVIHWVRPLWPAALMAVAAATVVSVVFDLAARGVAEVGKIPSGLPMPSLPSVGSGDWQALMLPALGVAVLAYSDNMLGARAFPAPEIPGERPSERAVDPQVELVALGGAHVAVGLFGGFPVSSSGSRTALALASRARSQMYSLVAALCVFAVLFIAGPLMEHLPQASLGAVVLYAATKLVKGGEFRRMWTFRKREVLLALVTLVGTIWLGLLYGVGLAIAISLLEMAQRLARPHDAVLGRVPGLAGMHDTADFPNAQTLPGLVIYRYEAPLFFANVGDLRRRTQRVLDKEFHGYPDAPPRWFLLNVEANTEVDVTACDGLKDLYADFKAQGVKLGLVRLKQDLYQPLRRAGVVDLIGEDMLFPTLPVAEEAYLAWAAAHPYVPTVVDDHAAVEEAALAAAHSAPGFAASAFSTHTVEAEEIGDPLAASEANADPAAPAQTPPATVSKTPPRGVSDLTPDHDHGERGDVLGTREGVRHTV
ncbi:MAG: STAS domain-containing protein [Tetrasphaera sp.]|jgi:SulP family sulfate permease|nr:STAS domain-containing protein [Tetrasphaera sp.]